MRLSSERAITPVSGPAATPGTAPRPMGAGRGARAFTVSPRTLRVVLVNAIIGVAALIWLLPAPWGGLVPVVLLAQLVWVRHGVAVALIGLVLGAVSGAALGAVLGMNDWRRAAVALLLLLLPAMAAWPERPTVR